jgi:hypothetical protein
MHLQEMSEANDFYRSLMDKAGASGGVVMKLGLPHFSPVGAPEDSPRTHSGGLAVNRAFHAGMYDFRHVSEQARRSSSSPRIIDLHTMYNGARKFG